MSTPVSIEPPPVAHLRTDSEQERDIQAKLQRLINLQYQDMQISEEQYTSLEEAGASSHHQEISDDQRETIGLLSTKRTTTELANLQSLGRESSDVSDPPLTSTTTPWPTETSSNRSSLPPPSPSQGIGQGTLLFPSTYQGARKLSHDSMTMPVYVPRSSEPAVETRTVGAYTTVPHASRPNQSQQPQLLHPPQHIYTGYGAVSQPPPELHSSPLPQHQFHYGNPDSMDEDDDNDVLRRGRRARRPRSLCEQMCCLYRPCVDYLRQEQIHRSFCYGAIDGLLTGSGIVSAFCALGVLSSHATLETRRAVVIFSIAACMADSLCMAMGHIWTSFVVSSGHSRERANEKQSLTQDKAEAKSKLVELLLARGMLKIDAMSLADTLEGYPDLFVNTIVGDPLLGGGVGYDEEPEEEEYDSDRERHHGTGYGSWTFPSYAKFSDMDLDEPENEGVHAAVKESQREGFFMMLGFAVFASIPSLLWLVVPPIIAPATPSTTKSHSVTPQTGDMISVPSVIVSILALIIWVLGIWKSRFLDSNWIIFGIETVVVLLVCVMAAYGIGLGLLYTLGGGVSGLVLTTQED